MVIDRQNYVIFFVFGLHHYECIAPVFAINLQRGQFWTRLMASLHIILWKLRSFFIQDINYLMPSVSHILSESSS